MKLTGEAVEASELPDNLPGFEASKKKITDLDVLWGVIEGVGVPVVAQAGEIFYLDPVLGWVLETNDFQKRLHIARARDGCKSMWSMALNFLRAPDPTSLLEPCTYWERHGYHMTEWKWTPIRLSENQIMFSDGVVTLLPNGGEEFFPMFEQKDIDGKKINIPRVIWGPRVGLEWATEDGEAPVCAEFEALVKHLFPNETVRRRLQALCGGILQPHWIMRGEIAIWGVTGGGKTTFATAIGCCPGGGVGVSLIPAAQLVRNKWTVSGLMNKFVNISDDSPLVEGWGPFLKNYTTGSVLVENKYAPPAVVSATAKLISCGNDLQNIADPSGAATGRLFPFQVRKSLPNRSDTAKMGRGYWSAVERRRGILTWLLEGVRLRLTEGAHGDEGESVTARKAADPLEAWLREEIEAGGDSEISLTEIVRRIPAGTAGRSDNVLNRIVSEYICRIFGKEGVRKRHGGGEKTRVYNGLRFVE